MQLMEVLKVDLMYEWIIKVAPPQKKLQPLQHQKTKSKGHMNSSHLTAHGQFVG